MKQTRKEKLTNAAVEFAKKGDLGGGYNYLYDGFIAGARWADYNQPGVIDEDFAWAIYNFINAWKDGFFGSHSLQLALAKNFSEYEKQSR